jgi:hypothetical protein
MTGFLTTTLRMTVLSGYSSTITIHITPNRSVSIPNRGEKNVFANGMETCPPSARPVKRR